jgi:outer membrane protein assembly factor BamB
MENGSTLFVDSKLGILKEINLSNKTSYVWKYYDQKLLLKEPWWVHRDKNNKLFIVDRANNHIIVLNESRALERIIKGEGVGNFNEPLFCVVNLDKLYISDWGNSRIVVLYIHKSFFPLRIIEHPLIQNPRAFHINSDGKTIYLADDVAHCIWRINENNNVEAVYGIPNKPGQNIYQLNSPKTVQLLKNGNLLICDSSNNRILETNPAREIVWTFPRKKSNIFSTNLWKPQCALKLSNQNILISDSLNSRLIEISYEGEIVWQYGKHNPLYGSVFNNPRSIRKTNRTTFIVSDTCNNRIIEMDNNGQFLWQYGGHQEKGKYSLYWPRDAIQLNSKEIAVADGLNSRILILNKFTNKVRIINEFFVKGHKYQLGDPHSLELTKEDNLLISDPLLDLVLEISLDGKVIWIYPHNWPQERNLNDPHYACYFGNFILVCDTKNNRILRCDRDLQKTATIQSVTDGSIKTSLNCPRFIQVLTKKFLIVDSGNNRILLTNNKFELISEVTLLSQSFSNLQTKRPRWALLDKGYLYLSDTENCRILKFKVQF